MLAVLLVDQISKIVVKLTMYHDQTHQLFGDWRGAEFLFVENEGMAFGWMLGGEGGKLVLSLFRIIAVVVIWRYLKKLVEKEAHKGLVFAIAMILAGAVGNIIDSMFYGIIFTDSARGGPVATFAALGEGYAAAKPMGGFLFGKVVDFLHFPFWKGTFPDWFPFWGGESFVFFQPIFNVADFAITAGVVQIIIRQKKYFGGQVGFFRKRKSEEPEEAEAAAEAGDESSAAEAQAEPPKESTEGEGEADPSTEGSDQLSKEESSTEPESDDPRKVEGNDAP